MTLPLEDLRVLAPTRMGENLVTTRQEKPHAFPTRRVAGFTIASTTPASATAWLCNKAAASGGQPIDVHLINAYSIASAESDDALHEVFAGAGINLADGKPLSWLTTFGANPLTQTRGPQLFTDVLDVGRVHGVTHFLLGSSEKTLARLHVELYRRYPGVQIVGAYSPPLRPLSYEERSRQDAMIRSSGAGIVWVALGTPKQDFEAQRISRSTKRITVAIGAAFDFVAGTQREAPAWVRRLGMEWFYRLANEPRRLGHRYLVGNLRFLYAVVRRRGVGLPR
ncbi:WecB/TagA/CpsF family glycosyltransferase [Cryobacterium sp. Y82]|uniref:WecB/TagA/CpsF family glycosyltransferase n=1 Tax=Cryobacterium sp. Y82 TaxID=2045017 RepID=UPI000CE4680A|nr:WecB/TagA/CpsF family glycosyltransferase [Cryobacterium sp. Y82]